MKSVQLVTIFVVLLFSLNIKAKAADIFDLGQPYFETILGGNYDLPTITGLAQGKDGLIWISTYEGLYRYDGYHITPVDYRSSDDEKFPPHWIRSLHISANGKLWVATASSGLYALDPTTRSYQQYQHDDNSNSISSNSINVVQSVNNGPDETNGIWIGSTKGLDYLDLKTTVFSHYGYAENAENGRKGDVISGLLIDRDGALWIGGATGINKLNEHGIIEERRFEQDSPAHLKANQQTITKIYQSSDGSIWFGSFAGGGYQITPNGTLRKLPGTGWVRDIIQIPSGDIWLSTARQGIQTYSETTGQRTGEHRHSQSSAETLDSDNAVSFMLDKSKLLWISTQGKGLSRVNTDNQFARSLSHSPSDKHSLSHNDIYAIHEMQDDTVWFSTYGKGVDIFDPRIGKIESIRPALGDKNALQEGTIKAISQTNDGSIWLGSLNSGLYKRNPGSTKLTRYTQDNANLFSNRIFRLIPESNGNLLVVTRKGINRHLVESNTFERIVDSEFKKTGSLYYKALMPGGDLWLASPENLYRLAPNAKALSRIDIPSSLQQRLNNNRILALHSHGPDSAIMITQKARFRLSLNGEVLQHQELKSDILNNVEAFPGPDGRYWGANFVFDFESGITQALGRADGVFHRIRRPMASTKTKQGTFIFGGANGITMLRPSYFSSWNYNPHLVINEIYIDGIKQKGAADKVHLPSSAQGFTVEFSALDYSDPNSIRYAYKLEGFDENWNNTDSSRRIATYTNLNPGQYTLSVTGSNRLGEWSPHKVSLKVTIDPSWYQTSLFQVAALASFLSLLYGIYALRVRHLHRKRKLLQEMVKTRTIELESSLQNLRRTKDQLVASEKHASLGRLVRGMAHEINTPIGVVGMAASVLADGIFGIIHTTTKEPLLPEQAKRIHNKAEGANSLLKKNLGRINDLIGNFKLLAGDGEHKTEAILVQGLVDNVLRSNTQKFVAAKVTVTVQDDDKLELETIPSTLFQVINELLNNALIHGYEFAPDDSIEDRKIDIQLLHHAADEHSGAKISITISDNGQGIQAELLPKIFDPFVANNTNNVGLGLHAVFNNVTQLLKGDISCISESGVGTSFQVSIPVKRS